MLKEEIIALSLAFTLLVQSAQARETGKLSSSVFEIRYSDEGIISLKRVSDRMITSIQGGTAGQTIMIPVGDSDPIQVSIMRLTGTAENQVR